MLCTSQLQYSALQPSDAFGFGGTRKQISHLETPLQACRRLVDSSLETTLLTTTASLRIRRCCTEPLFIIHAALHLQPRVGFTACFFFSMHACARCEFHSNEKAAVTCSQLTSVQHVVVNEQYESQLRKSSSFISATWVLASHSTPADSTGSTAGLQEALY